MREQVYKGSKWDVFHQAKEQKILQLNVIKSYQGKKRKCTPDTFLMRKAVIKKKEANLKIKTQSSKSIQAKSGSLKRLIMKQVIYSNYKYGKRKEIFGPKRL